MDGIYFEMQKIFTVNDLNSKFGVSEIKKLNKAIESANKG